MKDGTPFNEDYYERGVEKGISGYTNYHWRPDYMMPLANLIKERFGSGRTLDYGCAKGYLVKALRLLGVDAWGYDISEYATQNADPMVREFVFSRLTDIPPAQHLNIRAAIVFDTVIAKDTLEHVPAEQLPEVLCLLRKLCRGRCMVVVPLGDNGRYRIREYELDKTHEIREDEVWWIQRFREADFEIDEFHYHLPGVKDHWVKVNPIGNGIFILR